MVNIVLSRIGITIYTVTSFFAGSLQRNISNSGAQLTAASIDLTNVYNLHTLYYAEKHFCDAWNYICIIIIVLFKNYQMLTME